MKLVSSHIGVFKRKTSGFLDKPVNQSRDLYVVRHCPDCTLRIWRGEAHCQVNSSLFTRCGNQDILPDVDSFKNREQGFYQVMASTRLKDIPRALQKMQPDATNLRQMLKLFTPIYSLHTFSIRSLLSLITIRRHTTNLGFQYTTHIYDGFPQFQINLLHPHSLL